jgi:hypothetical protein
MKTVFHILSFCFLVVVILSTTLVLFAVGNKPETELDWSLSHDDITRAKKILHEGSKIKPDEINTIELNAVDLNLAANYLLNRYSKSAAKIELKNDQLRFNVTVTLPDNALGRYLNISFRLGNDDDSPLPSITKFKAGKLLLPAALSAWVIDTVIQHTSLNEYFILATRPINAIEIDSKKLTINYYPNPETLIQAKNLLTHGDIKPAQNVYQQKLSEVIASHDPEWRLSLADILKPLFGMAYQRSTLDNAIEENRTVIFTVNDYVNKLGTQKLLAGNPRANDKDYPAFLYKRIDLAQHFIGSAALTASVNRQVAQAMGEEKELSDAQGGSGFSFIDLAADKAGTRFGEIATASPENARQVQKAMLNIKDYTDFMPDPRDLPEHMGEDEFKQRYQSVNSPAYQKVLNLIDARIAATPIYQLQGVR